MPQLDMYLWFFNLVIFVSFFLVSYYLFLYVVLVQVAKLFFFRKLYVAKLISLRFVLNFKSVMVINSNYYLLRYIQNLRNLVNFERKSIDFAELNKQYWLSLFFLKNIYLNEDDFFIDFELIDSFFFFAEKKFFFQSLPVLER